VTALSVFGGVIFSGSKLKDYLDKKNKEVSFNAALSLYDEITLFRGKLTQIRIRLNYAIEVIKESFDTQKPLSPTKYIELQEIGIIAFETSLTIANLFIKTNNFNAIFNDKSLEKVTKLVEITNEITVKINNFFNCLIISSKGKVITMEEFKILYMHSNKYDEFSQEYLKACTAIQQTKFEEFCKFK
jgi:hypothetical protein